MAAPASTRRERRQARLVTQRETRRARAQPQWVVPAIGGIFLLSGSAGLVHEVVWARLMGHVFGATSLAISTVLAAYMGGLALGSWWIGSRMGRLGDRRRLYALLEIGIGVFALLIPLLLHLVEPVYGWIWRRFHFSFAVFSVLRFLIAGSLLLGPTALMGATLPALADYFAGLQGRRLAPQWLYTVNLAGAVLGVAVAGFFLMPAVGIWGTIVCGAAVNIGAGVAVLRLPQLAARPEVTPVEAVAAPRLGRLLLAAAFLSGVMSFATQVAWTRVLVLIVGSTTYAFSTVLLVYLVALTAGAWWASRWGARVARVEPLLAGAHLLMGACMLGAVYAVNGIPVWYFETFKAWRPASLAAVVALNTSVVFGLLITPVLFAGTVLPLAMIGTLPPGARGTGATVGRVYAVNTVGGILGAVLGGFLFVPLLGSERTLVGIALAGAAIGVVFALQDRSRRWLVGGALAGAAGIAAGALLSPDWELKPLNAAVFEPRLQYGVDSVRRPTDTVLFHREGTTATVMVLEEESGRRSLRINGRPNASDYTTDMSTQVMMAQIPRLLAPRADDVLVIGWGSGVSVGSMLASSPGRVTAVELEPAVVEASRFFSHVNHDPLTSARLELFKDDARHLLRASEATFDVIISEPSHPWVTGVASLFTRDFFALAANRLRSDGVFAQWLQAYQIAPDTYQSLLATFQSVFPEVMVFRSANAGGDSILLGSRRALRFDLAEIDRRWADPDTRAENARIGLKRPEDLLATLYAGPDAVRAFVKNAPINTDNNMLVEFRAPKDMVVRPGGAVRDIFAGLQQYPTPLDSMVTDPTAFVGNRERLEALVRALEQRKRPTERYRALLASTGRS